MPDKAKLSAKAKAQKRSDDGKFSKQGASARTDKLKAERSSRFAPQESGIRRGVRKERARMAMAKSKPSTPESKRQRMIRATNVPGGAVAGSEAAKYWSKVAAQLRGRAKASAKRK